MTKHPQVLLEALSALNAAHPFFAHYFYQRNKVKSVHADDPEALAIPTAATDGKTITFNVDFTEGLASVHERMFVAAHEIEHDVYGHIAMMARFGETGRVPTPDGMGTHPYNQALFNIAADARINDDLVRCKMKMPMKDGKPLGILFDWVTMEMSVIDIYDKLMEELDEETKERLGKPGDGEGTPVPGSNGGGQFDEHQKPAKAEGPAEEEARRQAIQQAVAQGKLAGKLPAHMNRLVELTKPPKVDWREVLKDLVQRIPGADMLDHTRYHRRTFLLTTMIAPRRRSERCEDIVFVVDTSGSTHAYIEQFLSEVASVAEELSPRSIVVLWTDTQVSYVDTLEEAQAADVAALTVRGGGGTDLRSAFAYIEDGEHEIEPAGMVILTDSYTAWPDADPGYPVICATTTPGLDHPKWMQVVGIDT